MITRMLQDVFELIWVVYQAVAVMALTIVLLFGVFRNGSGEVTYTGVAQELIKMHTKQGGDDDR